MDISRVSDQNLLKALAYDEMLTLERSQNNLRLLQGRMAELQQQDSEKEQVADREKTVKKIEVKEEDDLQPEELPESGK